MFIEKIPKEAKKRYIQEYVDNLNRKRFGHTEKEFDEAEKLSTKMGLGGVYIPDELYRKMPVEKSTIKDMKANGILKKIDELTKKNIFVKLYYSLGEDIDHCYSYQHAVIAVFGDTSVKVFKVDVGCRSYYDWSMRSALGFIEKNKEKMSITNNLATDQDYIKNFMLPELSKIDEQKGTNLTEKYKNVISQIIEQKRELVNNKFDATRTDLGLGK